MSAIYCTPGPDNSNLIKTEKAVPISPENKAKIRYNVPMSFALEDKNHLSVQREIDAFFISLQTMINLTKGDGIVPSFSFTFKFPVVFHAPCSCLSALSNTNTDFCFDGFNSFFLDVKSL